MTPDEWTRSIIDEVRKISDRDYQEKTWFGGREEICSPEEHFCGLFDDFLFDQFPADDRIALTDEQRTVARALKLALEDYLARAGEPQDPRNVIDDPQWKNVRGLAKAFLRTMERDD